MAFGQGCPQSVLTIRSCLLPNPPLCLFLSRVCFVPRLPYLIRVKQVFERVGQEGKQGVCNGRRGMAIALLSYLSLSPLRRSPPCSPLTSHLLLSSSPSCVTSASRTFHSLCPYSAEMPKILPQSLSGLEAKASHSLDRVTLLLLLLVVVVVANLVGSVCCAMRRGGDCSQVSETGRGRHIRLAQTGRQRESSRGGTVRASSPPPHKQAHPLCKPTPPMPISMRLGFTWVTFVWITL